jgi:hypothetical protein
MHSFRKSIPYIHLNEKSLANDFAVHVLFDLRRDYVTSAIHGCFKSSVADILSSGRHLSIERMKSRNNSFSSPSITGSLSSSEILGILTLLEPPVQCPIKLSTVNVGTTSVTDLARRIPSLLYRCFACIEAEAFQGTQPFRKHDVSLMICPRCHGR